MVLGQARFVDPRTIRVTSPDGACLLSAKYFLLTTGARPAVPQVPGLADVPYLTYEQIFDLDRDWRLPERMVVIGRTFGARPCDRKSSRT